MTDLELTARLAEIMHPVEVTPEIAERIYNAVKSHMGKVAGSKTSDAKTKANRLNGLRPAGEGKKKGRPFGSKNQNALDKI